MITSPMLCAKLPANATPDELRQIIPFPVLASIKFDGIRVERIDDIVRSGRNFKELANSYIYHKIADECQGELDGKLLLSQTENKMISIQFNLGNVSLWRTWF
jgi:hypothetical protein